MCTMRFFSGARASAWGGATRVLLGAAVAAVLSLSACGGSDDHVDRGPTTVPISAKLNGLYWDAGESRLYLTDDRSNTIKAWDGGQNFDTVASLPAAPASGATLGQLTRGADSALYTTRFGFGTDGTVVAVAKSGAPYNLSGLDATRRRIGITTAPGGALIEGWFIRGGTGSISQLSVTGGAGSERELVTGLGKPVGLAVAGDQLFVSDQNTAQVLVYSLAVVRAQPATAAAGKVHHGRWPGRDDRGQRRHAVPGRHRRQAVPDQPQRRGEDPGQRLAGDSRRGAGRAQPASVRGRGRRAGQ